MKRSVKDKVLKIFLNILAMFRNLINKILKIFKLTNNNIKNTKKTKQF